MVYAGPVLPTVSLQPDTNCSTKEKAQHTCEEKRKSDYEQKLSGDDECTRNLNYFTERGKKPMQTPTSALYVNLRLTPVR